MTLYGHKDQDVDMSDAHESSTRVLQPPGGQGDDVYQALYGGDTAVPSSKSSTRVQREPGGGGSDAHEALYGGGSRFEQTASVRVQREPGGGGNAMYQTIYDSGDVIAMVRPQVRVLREPGGGGDSMQTHLYGSSPRGKSVVAVVDASSIQGGNENSSHSSAESMKLSAAEPMDVEEMDAVTDDAEMDVEMAKPSSAAVDAAVVFPFPVLEPSVFVPECSDENEQDLFSKLLAKVRNSSMIDLMPFELVVQAHIAEPIRALHDNLDALALQWLRSSLHIKAHCGWLRRLMLMGDGLCMDIFARDLLAALHSPTGVTMGLPGRLTEALIMSMTEARTVQDNISRLFHYHVASNTAEVFSSWHVGGKVTDVLDRIELRYTLQWPFGVVFSLSALATYTRVHRLLLFLRLTHLELTAASLQLRKGTRQVQRSSVPAQRHECHLSDQLLSMAHFVMNALSESLIGNVLVVLWNDFETNISNARSVRDLRKLHDEFVDRVAHACLLGRGANADELHAALMETLHPIWQFTALVRTFEVVPGSLQDTASTQLRELCQELHTKVQALVHHLARMHNYPERSARDAAQVLLLRLQFNHYFTDE
ncbi:TPA: hypothetical protein N0F65_009117 [Lagenidium giganteum]|uniref:Spindle pole body component n=1 Tax=Lagenidium giganteum TaxID=4803 RepID=A0AAV2YRB8_9STRA|nr:TPA: hypothetical protein N0F65_009117 [Lagenidium giganteum]